MAHPASTSSNPRANPVVSPCGPKMVSAHRLPAADRANWEKLDPAFTSLLKALLRLPNTQNTVFGDFTIRNWDVKRSPNRSHRRSAASSPPGATVNKWVGFLMHRAGPRTSRHFRFSLKAL